jgi:hypothetical protein
MAEPNPSNVAPWYLRNINEALELDPITGNVSVAVSSTATIQKASSAIVWNND